MEQKSKYKKDLIFYFEYAGYRIFIYPRKITDKAMEFLLFDANGKISKTTIWIPKSTFSQREGKELLGVYWLFNENENREKLELLGYRL